VVVSDCYIYMLHILPFIQDKINIGIVKAICGKWMALRESVHMKKYVCKGWAIKTSPCTATFNDLLCYPYSLTLY
jgi:hypothetical protein